MARRTLACIVFMIFVLPVSVFAQIDDDSDSKDSFIDVSGFYSTEFNLRNSGNSVVFSPTDTRGSTYPAQDTVGPNDRKKSFWRNRLNLTIACDYAELQLGIHTQADDFMWPDSVGLEVSLLFPVYFLTENLEIGIYHNSAHNLVEERYGKGIDVTGLHLSYDFSDSLKVWGTYNFVNDKGSSFVFTKSAQEMPHEDLGVFKWAVGIKSVNEDTGFKRTLSVAVSGTDDGWAAVRARSETLLKLGSDIAIGLFIEYNRNLRKRNRFGRYEWLIGPMLEIKF